MVRSRPPLMIRRPSGEKAIERTGSLCPFKVRIGRPVLVSHSLIVVSSEDDAITLPSGEYVTARTHPAWALTVRMSLPLGTSQYFIVLSRLPLTRTVPSGEKAKPPIQFSKAVSQPSWDSTHWPRRSIVPSKGSDL